MFVTIVFAILMWIAESRTNADFGFIDALVWTFVKYVDDPADVTSSPVTLFGQVVGTLVGVLGIAIFAVPAGLIGSGLMDAMDEERHEKEVEGNYRRLCKVFRREVNKSLRTYLNTLPDKGGAAFAKLNFVPQYVPVSRVQIRQGLDVKNVFEVCERHPELRIKNLAEAMSEEDCPDDRFVLSTFPMNSSYGCCIDRRSKVTIVCPVGFSEVGTGWFCYYLAKFGGFNFVCKELEVDSDELDSFYNMADEPLYEKKTRAQIPSKDKAAHAVLDEKEKRRREFLADIKSLNSGAGSWVIMIAAHLKHSENRDDFHFAYSKKDGTAPTVDDVATYGRFLTRFNEVMGQGLGMTAVDASPRFPFVSKNLAYRLRDKEGMECNVFALRPSTELMIFDAKKMLYAYSMAGVISEVFDDGKGIEPADVDDFATTGFGYAENRHL